MILQRRSQWPSGLRRGSAAARCWDCGFESRRGHGYLSVVSVVCLSGRGFCDGLITRAEESYRLCCVLVCDLKSSRMRLKPEVGCKSQ